LGEEQKTVAISTSVRLASGMQSPWLTALSQQAHQLAAAGDEVGLAVVEAQVDEAAAKLWGITDRELKEIRRSLEELG